LLEVDGGTVNRFDYIFDKSILNGAAQDFETALHQAVSHLSGKDVTMMFSGCRVSFVLYLALQQVQGEGTITPVTIDWRPESLAQGPFQAKPVADSLEWIWK